MRALKWKTLNQQLLTLGRCCQGSAASWEVSDNGSGSTSVHHEQRRPTSHWSPPPSLKCLHWQCLQVSTGTHSGPETFLQLKRSPQDRRSPTLHRWRRCLWCEARRARARPLFLDVQSSTWPGLWCSVRLPLLVHLDIWRTHAPWNLSHVTILTVNK